MGVGVETGKWRSIAPALGFGIAGLFNEPSKTARRRMIESALDMGIQHFDMAPIYGLGLAEEEFGQIVGRRRAKVFIATKVGIAPTPLARVLGRVQAPVRKALRASPSFHQQMRSSATGPSSGRLGGLLYAKTYEPMAAKRSLEASLRALGTDYIDLLLLHDPDPSDLRFDEVYAFLEDARVSGYILHWGVAGESEPTLDAVNRIPGETPVVQIRDDIFHREGVSSGTTSESFRITFGVLGEALPRILAHITASTDRANHWNEATGADCTDSEAVASLLLKDAFAANPEGVVLYSTTRSERMRKATELFNRAAEAEESSLIAFRRLVADQFSTIGEGTNDQA